MTLQVSVSADAAPAVAALSALAELAQSRLEVVQAFLSSGDPLVELRQVHIDPGTTNAADVLVRLEPSHGLAVFLAAARAGQCDGV